MIISGPCKADDCITSHEFGNISFYTKFSFNALFKRRCFFYFLKLFNIVKFYYLLAD